MRPAEGADTNDDDKPGRSLLEVVARLKRTPFLKDLERTDPTRYREIIETLTSQAFERQRRHRNC